jgi:hypothetical protein
MLLPIHLEVGNANYCTVEGRSNGAPSGQVPNRGDCTKPRNEVK